jgi:hypothetical protein
MSVTNSPIVPPIRIAEVPSFAAELNSHLTAYLTNKSRKPPRESKSRLLPYIAALRVEAAERKEYKTASRLAQAERELRAYFQSEMHHDRAVRAVQTPATPSSGLALRLQSATRRFDNEIADFTRSRKQFMQELRLAQEFELKEFHDRWADPECLKAYTKASPSLLQLREIERRKVLLMDYDGADEVRKVADRVEAEETALAQEKIRKGREIQLAQMEKRHKMEFDAAERLTEKKLCHLRTEKDSMVLPLQKQIAKAAKREELEPVVIRAFSSRGRRNRSPRYEGDDVDLASPRTYTKVMRMRTSTGVKRLKVDGADPDSPRRTASRRSQSVKRNRV